MSYCITSYNIKRRATELKAAVFGCFLLCLMTGLIAVSLSANGPIILGTELNTDGMVEYMCLGNGCETLRDFHWKD